MYIVLVGAGKIGTLLTGYLTQESHDVVIVDKNPARVQEMINSFDVNGINGGATSLETLKEAGVSHADLVVALTGDDEDNILCCMMSHRLGAARTIARVSDPEYQKQWSFMREELGINMLVNPEYEAAAAMARIMRFPSAIKLNTFAGGKIDVIEIRMEDGSFLDGKALYMLPRIYKERVLICAVDRGGEVTIPSGDFVLKSGDKLYIAASHDQLIAFLKSIGVYRQKIRKIMLVGGGRVGFYLSKMLSESGMDVRLIEKDSARCLELNTRLPRVLISHGDGTDEKVLREEGIEHMDAFASLTGIDEENVITSMYATTCGVMKVATKVDRASFAGIIEKMAVGSIISAKDAAASLILGYIRGMKNSRGGHVRTMYKLVDGSAEALEFIVSDNAPFVGTPLKELRIKKQILIAGIIRGNQVIYPHGDDFMQPKDRVIVVAANRHLSDLHEIFN